MPNIVGYINESAREFYSLKVAPFDKVGGEGYNIQELIPVAPADWEEGLGGGVFDLQTFTDGAGCDQQFFYMTPEDDEAYTQAGWYVDGDPEQFADKVFAPGEGFMFNNTIGLEAGLTFAGQVNLEQIDIPACEFFSLMGNPRAVKISIQDLQPVVADPEGYIGGGVFDLQTFTDGAGCDQQFFYMIPEDDEAYTQAGWYVDADPEQFSDKVFDPAEGFMFNNTFGAEAVLRYASAK